METPGDTKEVQQKEESKAKKETMQWMKRLKEFWIILSILILLIVGAGFWGYHLYKENMKYGYEKPEEIKHYEKIRDELTVPKKEEVKPVETVVKEEQSDVCTGRNNLYNQTTTLDSMDRETTLSMMRFVQTLFPIMAIIMLTSQVIMIFNSRKVDLGKLIGMILTTMIFLFVGNSILQAVMTVIC